MAPFYGEVYDEIADRANGESELSHTKDRPRDRAHLLHGQGRIFNQAPNGLYVTDIEHLAFHRMFRGRARHIGLTEGGNLDAVEYINNRVLKFDMRNNLLVDHDEEIRYATRLWEIYLSAHAIPTKAQLKMALADCARHQEEHDKDQGFRFWLNRSINSRG